MPGKVERCLRGYLPVAHLRAQMRMGASFVTSGAGLGSGPGPPTSSAGVTRWALARQALGGLGRALAGLGRALAGLGRARTFPTQGCRWVGPRSGRPHLISEVSRIAYQMIVAGLCCVTARPKKRGGGDLGALDPIYERDHNTPGLDQKIATQVESAVVIEEGGRG